jgi:hypothetical protein
MMNLGGVKAAIALGFDAVKRRLIGPLPFPSSSATGSHIQSMSVVQLIDTVFVNQDKGRV